MNLQQPDRETVAAILARSSKRVVMGILNKECPTDARDAEANKNGLLGVKWKQKPDTVKRKVAAMRRAKILMFLQDISPRRASTKEILKALNCTSYATLNEDLKVMRTTGAIPCDPPASTEICYSRVYWAQK